MTYRRDAGSFAEAMTACLRAGQDWLAERIGVSTSRLRQCANPMRGDSLPLHLACRADIAAASLGLGTPLFDCYRRRLAEAGALTLPPFERRATRLVAACRAAATILLSAIADPDQTQEAAA